MDSASGLQPNPYLFEIESSKKKAGLAHEQGAGAPCLKCRERCEGFDLHYWRKICKNCRCPKEEHDIREQEDPAVKRIGRLFDKPMQDYDNLSLQYGKMKLPGPGVMNGGTGVAVSEVINFDWIPPDTSTGLAKKYMDMLPEGQQPIKDSAGALYRKRQMERQLPNHDIDPTACDSLTDFEVEKLNKFVDMFKKNSLGIGRIKEMPKTMTIPDVAGGGDTSVDWKCWHCKKGMSPGDVAVFAERAGSNRCWHPACFKCSSCSELLVDLIYFFHEGEVFCGRHYADRLKPRCAACDELIFAKEYTQAEGQNWHLKHFCCWHCDIPLGGKRYVAKETKPYCLHCYENVLAKVCEACQQKIAADAPRLSYKELHWHATEDCFHCAHCQLDLRNQQFMCKSNLIFCSVTCKRKVLPPSGSTNV